MKRGIIITILAFIFGIVGYHATLHFIPNIIYSKFKEKSLSTLDSQTNQTNIILAPDENSRAVVKPNPDFAYVSAFYDVTEKPIQIIGQMPDSTYWSVAFYEPNTTNFYVKNDIQFGSNKLNIVLGKNNPTNNKAEFVKATTDEGFMLIRVLVTDKSVENLLKMENILNQIRLDHFNM